MDTGKTQRSVLQSVKAGKRSGLAKLAASRPSRAAAMAAQHACRDEDWLLAWACMRRPADPSMDNGSPAEMDSQSWSAEAVRDRLYAAYTRGFDAPLPALATAPSPHYLRRLVRRHFPDAQAAEIVELGCGEGRLLRVLRAAGYSNAVGVDRSPDQVARGRTAADGLAIEEGDALAYLRSLSASSKDVVVALDMLEHLRREEAIALLDEAHRVLRPSGRIVLHTVNAGSPFFGRILYGDLTHETAFTASSLRQLFDLSAFHEPRFYEDDPVVHGLRSGFRSLLWRAVRAGLSAYLTVETGSPQNAIFSQGFVAVALR